MKWYRITFFGNEASPSNWTDFFKTVLEDGKKIKIRVVHQNRRIEFFVGCSKKIDVLNSRLSPFYLADDLTDEELAVVDREWRGNGLGAKWLKDNLFEFLEKESMNGKEVRVVAFGMNKYNPFKDLPGYVLVYLVGEKLMAKGTVPLIHVYQFLAFNLNNCISSEIAKVKAELTNSKMNFSVYPEGICKVKRIEENLMSIKSYDFWRHSLIIGQSGSGKSFLMKLMIEDWFRKNYGNEYSFVLIDPHASLTGLVSTEVGPKVLIDFKETSTNLFVNVGQPTLSTELTMDLFSTVMDVRGNQNLARVLKYALNLLFGIDKMSLVNLKSLITDSVWRKGILKEVNDENILKFFETEFQQIYSSQYAVAVLPVINLISELDFIGNASREVSLADELNRNFLTCFPVKQTELGKNITRIIGGAIIQQIFTIMQAGLVKKKVVLMVDEVSVIQTPSLVHILSEARKFGLTVVLTQQYLMQVSADVLQSIFANMVNYFAFKLARDDAEIVAKNLNFEIDEFFLKNKNDPREVNELGVKILTDLNPREVVCRIMAAEIYCSPFKAKTVSVKI